MKCTNGHFVPLDTSFADDVAIPSDEHRRNLEIILGNHHYSNANEEQILQRLLVNNARLDQFTKAHLIQQISLAIDQM